MPASATVRVLLLATVTGCAAAQPVVMHGDANSVEVSSVGSVAKAEPLARRHCSQFEKVPQYRNTDGEFVLFDCVRR